MKIVNSLFLLILGTTGVLFAQAEFAESAPGRSGALGGVCLVPDDVVGTLDLAALTNTGGAPSIEFADGFFWVTSAGEASLADPNMLFKIAADGSTVEPFVQPTTSDWGWRDLTFDGTFLYGSDSDVIEQIRLTDGQPTGVTIPSPLPAPSEANPARALAYDPATDHFWVANQDSDLYEIDRDGNIINQFSQNHQIFGLAWDATAPGGAVIWAWHQDNFNEGTPIDPATGADLAGCLGGIDLGGFGAGGADITTSFIPGERVFVGLHQTTSAAMYLLGSDLSVEVSADTSTPDLGDSITYTISLANAGPDHIATGVAVSAALPSGLTFESSSASVGTYDSGTGVWTLGQIDNTSTSTLTVTAEVSALGTKVMTAEVSASDTSDVDSTPGNDDAAEDDQDSVTVTPRSADLSLDLVVDNFTPTVGQTVTYQVRLSSDGPDVVNSATVVNQLPAGVTYSTHTTDQGSYDQVSGVWDIPTMTPGATFVLFVEAVVDSAAPITNSAEVTASDTGDPDSTPGNDIPSEDDQASVTIAPTLADLAVVKTVNNATPNVGETLIFTVTLSNNGPTDAGSVEVTDVLPAGLFFDGATASQGTYNSGTGIWAAGAVTNGSAATLTIEAFVNGTGSFTNTATISSSDTADNVPANNTSSVSVTTLEADLSLVQTVDNDTPEVGETVTFTLNLSNGGPNDATGVTVTNLFTGGLTFVSADPAGQYNSVSGVWTVGTVSAAGTATLTISATVDTIGQQTSISEVTASDVFDPDSIPGNEATSEDDYDFATLVSRSADLSVELAASSLDPFIGSEITFTITLNNDGPNSATGVEVTDQLPANLTFVSSQASLGTYSSGTGIWTLGTVDSNSSHTLDLVALVGNTTDAITNTAELTASNAADPDSTPNNGDAGEDDQASVGIVPQEVAAEIYVQIGQPIEISGTPNGSVGIYQWIDGEWVLQEVVVLDSDGNGTTVLIAEPDSTYGVGSPDGSVLPEAGTEVTTVPTLGEWGMIFFVLLLMAAALVSMRRQRLA